MHDETCKKLFAFPRLIEVFLLFAPARYLDRAMLHRCRITFQQLPFEIYEAVEKLER